MKILIFGAGAIGSAFGGFLSRYHQVTLLGRKKHLEAIRKNGLQVTGIWGRHCFHFFQLVENVRQLDPQSLPFDLVLVTVKSYDTAQAAKTLRKLVHPKTCFLSLQNGLGNIETLCRYLPARQVLAGRVIFGVELEHSGRIHVSVIAQPNAIGEIAQRRITPRVKKIARAFDQAGLPSKPVADVLSFLWTKVIYNAALNPLASLLGSHYGSLGKRVFTRAVIDAVIEESYAVSKKARVPLHPRTPRAYKKLFYGKLLPRTFHHHPSMLQDLQKGKRTEINALNGMIVRLGRRYGVPTPANAFLTTRIKQKERAGKR